MYVPTVNIVMTYRPSVMMRFQRTGSLQAFIDDQKKREEQDKTSSTKHTYIFNNTPNSNLISLTHALDENTGAVMEVELLDPQGVFEESMLDNSMQKKLASSLDPKVAHIEKLENEIETTKAERNALQAKINKQNAMGYEQYSPLGMVGEEAEWKRSVDESNLAMLKDDVTTLNKRLDAANSLAENDSKSRAENREMKQEILEEELERLVPQLQRPVYITYGMGDDLNDWSPPQCYGKVWKLEYSFDGNGVRRLKLIFVGIGAHPNLLEGFGVSKFGKAYTNGLLTKGMSSTIFNAEAAKKEADLLKELYADTGTLVTTSTNEGGNERLKALGLSPVSDQTDNKWVIDKYVGDWVNPSFHKLVVDALTDFLKRGSKFTNVLVLFPNLDRWLYKYLVKCRKDARAALTKEVAAPRGAAARIAFAEGVSAPPPPPEILPLEAIVNFQGMKAALNGIGMELCDGSRFTQVKNGKTIIDAEKNALPMGDNVYAALEQCESAEDAAPWFQSRQCRAVVQCDYKEPQSFLAKLQDVGAKLEELFTEYALEGAPSVAVSFPSAETDFRMIQLLFDAGLVPDFTKPVVTWGDSRFINNFLNAELLEINARTLARKMGKEDEQISDATMSLGDLATYANSQVDKFVHPLDQLKGLNNEYMQTVLNYIIPIPTLGPWGPNYSSDEDIISNDTNIQQSTIQEVKNNQPFRASRMPVFTFGTTNPNVLGINIDLNEMYNVVMQGETPKLDQSNQIVAGFIPDDQKTMVRSMFVNLEEMTRNRTQAQKDSDVPPKEFVEMIQQWWDQDSGNSGELGGDDFGTAWLGGESEATGSFDDWAEVFDALATHKGWKADDEYRKSQLIDRDFKGGSGQFGLYAKFMWKIFTRLYKEVNNQPLSERVMPPSDEPAKVIMASSSRMADRMMRETLTGSIKTLPLFNLSTGRRTFNRPCILHCIEPRFTSTNPTSSTPKKYRTWFSGLYEMVGFSHRITTTTAESEFTIIRGATRGADLMEEGDFNKVPPTDEEKEAQAKLALEQAEKENAERSLGEQLQAGYEAFQGGG